MVGDLLVLTASKRTGRLPRRGKALGQKSGDGQPGCALRPAHVHTLCDCMHLLAPTPSPRASKALENCKTNDRKNAPISRGPLRFDQTHCKRKGPLLVRDPPQFHDLHQKPKMISEILRFCKNLGISKFDETEANASKPRGTLTPCVKSKRT